MAINIGAQYPFIRILSFPTMSTLCLLFIRVNSSITWRGRYDVPFIITRWNTPIPTNVILAYSGTRPDGRLFQYSTESLHNDKVDVVDNRIIVTISDFMTEVSGGIRLTW